MTRADWNAKFGAQHVAGDSVLFQEDCQLPSLVALSSRLDSARGVDQWQCVAEALGAASPWEVRPDGKVPVYSSAYPGRLILLPYSGRPLTAAEIRSELGLTVESPHAYVVATAAVERRRAEEQLGGQHQVEKVLVPGKPPTERMLMTFPKVLRHFLRRGVLSRSEERVLMHRAIAAVAHADQLAVAQLKHDVFAWRDLLGELEKDRKWGTLPPPWLIDPKHGLDIDVKGALAGGDVVH